jgi:hypothetical protein
MTAYLDYWCLEWIHQSGAVWSRLVDPPQAPIRWFQMKKPQFYFVYKNFLYIKGTMSYHI